MGEALTRILTAFFCSRAQLPTTPVPRSCSRYSFLIPFSPPGRIQIEPVDMAHEPHAKSRWHPDERSIIALFRASMEDCAWPMPPKFLTVAQHSLPSSKFLLLKKDGIHPKTTGQGVCQGFPLTKKLLLYLPPWPQTNHCSMERAGGKIKGRVNRPGRQFLPCPFARMAICPGTALISRPGISLCLKSNCAGSHQDDPAQTASILDDICPRAPLIPMLCSNRYSASARHW